MKTPAEKSRIWIAYPAAISYSGQTGAATILISELGNRDWDCRAIPFPALDRAVVNPIARYGAYVGKTLAAWIRIFRLVFVRRPLVYFSHGQSLASFLRTGFPHWLLCLLNPRARVALALHGSVFMGWDANSLELRVFKALLRRSHRVTVLGEKQKRRLVEIGVPENKVQVLLNTCTLTVASPDAVTNAYSPLMQDKHAPLRLLHLSLLIESKGYPEYLEALELLSREPLSRPIDAVLCGPLSFSAYCRRFTTEEEKTRWIDGKLAAINQSDQVCAEWIRGARGKQKQELFDKAHLFVFPSRFPVEAQPLVIVEAMASGCAILASTAGEIPSTVDANCAELLDDPNHEAIAKSTRAYLDRPERLLAMGRAGVGRANSTFSQERYVRDWELLLRDLVEGRHTSS